MADTQDLFSFLDQLLLTKKGREQFERGVDRLSWKNPNAAVRDAFMQYEVLNTRKKNTLKQGHPIHLDTNKENVQNALSTYHPWRGRVLGQDFINTYPSQWAHIVDAMPQTPQEQRNLQNWWPILGERNTTAVPNWSEVQAGEKVSGPYRPNYTSNWTGIKTTVRSPALGVRPEYDVQRISTVRPNYDAWDHDYENWPVIPAKSDEVFDVNKLKDRIKDAEFELKWSLIPGIYRDIAKTKQRILNIPSIAKEIPKPKPPTAPPPFKPKKVEFKGSATEGLYTPSADKTAIYEAIRNLDEPFHPIISAGMIHTKFDNPIMMQRVKQQNEAVMKNRMNARKESTMWDDTALYGSETDRPGRLMNDAELKILDPRTWLPGFTREHMDLNSRNSLSDKELVAWQKLINPYIPDGSFGTGRDHPEDIRKLQGSNKLPHWQRNVLPPRSANTNPPPPTFEELRKRYPNVPDAEIHRLMKLGGMGGLGVLGIQTLDKAKRIGGR